MSINLQEKSSAKSAPISKKAIKAAAVELDSELALNDVLLRGRISTLAIEKELPSGDKVCEFRIVIARSNEEGFDAIDISAWSSKLRRTALALKSDQWVEVTGSIKRRFWRGAAGLSSRWQIDANEITRL
jgi:single-strand DNA-binding protein